MNILQVSSGSYTVGGGVSEYVRNISERLAVRHNVTVFAARTSRSLAKNEFIKGVKVERFQCYTPSGAFFFSWELLGKLLRKQYDVIHAHNYHAFPMHAAAMTSHKRFVVSPCFHGAGHTPFRDFVFKISKPVGKMTLRKADHILAASEYEKTLLCRQFVFKSDDVAVVPRGIAFSELQGLKRHKRDFKTVLFVGRLVKYKGAQYLIEILPKTGSDVFLQIVGKGPLRNRLEERAKELGVLDRIKFYQNLDRKELLQMYADADVFVLPSRHEAYSKVVAEALAIGTPCIVAETSALKEWVDNETCYGVDLPVDIAELSDLINRVIDMRPNVKAMKKWIGTKIIDWNEVVAKLEAIYSQ